MKLIHKLRQLEDQIDFFGISSLNPKTFFVIIRIAEEVNKFFQLYEFTPWLTMNPVHEGVYQTYLCTPVGRTSYRRFVPGVGWTLGCGTIEEASKEVEFDLSQHDEVLHWRGLTKDLRDA